MEISKQTSAERVPWEKNREVYEVLCSNNKKYYAVYEQTMSKTVLTYTV